jgi:hypothetical protein
VSNCECDTPAPLVLNIAAGLNALPRQLRSFPDVRAALLAARQGTDPAVLPLNAWRSTEGDDLGLMWLEMWAYVSDVIGFYDERIANESYLRTAALRPSVRRLVEQLGLTVGPGTAGSVSLAVLASGNAQVTVPSGTAFRSDAFGSEPPQIFETIKDFTIHPLKNQWSIGPIRNKLLPEVTPSLAAAGITTPQQPTPFLVFRTQDFGLARDRLVLFQSANFPSPGLVSKVKSFKPITGKDGQQYMEVEFDPPVNIPPNTDPTTVKVLTPTGTAGLTQDDNAESPSSPLRNLRGNGVAFLDSVNRQIKLNDPIIIQRESSAPPKSLQVFTVTGVREVNVNLPPPNPPAQPPSATVTTTDASNNKQTSTITVQGSMPPGQVLVTRLDLSGPVDADAFRQLSLHFTFIAAGTVTTVASREVTKIDLTSSPGVSILGIVDTPPPNANQTSANVLEQDFLIQDANKVGALVDGTMTFDVAGSAKFLVKTLTAGTLDGLKTPLTVFGNVIDAFRGESVFNEALGSGDPRTPNQVFKLQRKPLTYIGPQASLTVTVDGVEWTEAPTFFNTGPQDQIYVVSHDDNQETFVTFGDGVHGSLLSSGIKNVVATYRVGAGQAAPPANAISQISRPVDGLRAVVSPIDADGGQDPQTLDDLRQDAGTQALLIGRAVSVADFEALANNADNLLPPAAGNVIRAAAQFIWLPEEQRSGVQVTYVGTRDAADLLGQLQAQGDPDLTIKIVQATALPRTLAMNIGVDTRFIDPTQVSVAVVQALSDDQKGLLAVKNANIGGQFWVSRLYQAVMAVDGVTEVQSATLTDENGVVQSLASTDVVCIPTDSYFDFDEGRRVQITGVAPVGNVANQTRLTGGT